MARAKDTRTLDWEQPDRKVKPRKPPKKKVPVQTLHDMDAAILGVLKTRANRGSTVRELEGPLGLKPTSIHLRLMALQELGFVIKTPGERDGAVWVAT